MGIIPGRASRVPAERVDRLILKGNCMVAYYPVEGIDSFKYDRSKE